jgi:RimJ/RimL family protein N-acetyltransferase
MDTLETERLILRRWREEDRKPFAAMNRDVRVMEFFPALLTEEESNTGVGRIEAHFDRHGFGLWAVEVRDCGRLAGFIGMSIPRFEAVFMPCVEVGWRLAAEFWGRGMATEGARAAVRSGFEDLGLEELVSFTSVGNIKSRRVMEKLGMRHNAAEDFDHPHIAAGHPLLRHVLYRLNAEEWQHVQ